jgi:hypothetical protein
MKSLRYFVVLASLLLALAAIPSWAGPQLLDAEALAALRNNASSAEAHLKMAAHFQAAAENFEREAETHNAMGKRYDRPNLPPKVASLSRGMSRHCANLSRALNEAAKQAEQLSKSHRAMADEVGKQK